MRLAVSVFLAIIASSLTIQLSAQTSSLIVFNELKEDFYLVVNGQRINPNATQHVRVTELMPSQYKVEAIFASASLPKAVAQITVQANREISYALTKKGNTNGFEFSFLSEYSLGYYPIAPKDFITVSYSGPLHDPNSIPAPSGTSTTSPKPVHEEPTPKVTIGDPTNTAKPNPLPGYNGPVGCSNVMDPALFEEARKSIAAKSFSDTKMELAMQVTKANCLMASQVKQLMKLFSFESQKLEYAKFAYDYTYDRGNYYTVNDEFGFESSIRELSKFLDEK